MCTQFHAHYTSKDTHILDECKALWVSRSEHTRASHAACLAAACISHWRYIQYNCHDFSAFSRLFQHVTGMALRHSISVNILHNHKPW